MSTAVLPEAPQRAAPSASQIREIMARTAERVTVAPLLATFVSVSPTRRPVPVR